MAAVVSMLIERLGSMTFDRIGEEIKLVKGVKEDVRKLKTNLVLIQAVLQDAEEKQLNDAAVKIWLKELKNVSEEMENVLDEWSTAILEHEIKKEEAKAMTVRNPFFFNSVGPLIMSRDIAHKIKQFNEDLTRISQDRNNYGLNTTSTVIERPRPPQTTFLVNETRVHGRDEEKSLLVRKLLCESSTDDDDGSSSLHIIPIVGLGGLGKTTLAQLAYKDKAVETHFDKRVWVCVSDPFEELKVAKAIAEGLDNKSESSELNAVVERIHGSIEGKRVLIVLDDVWLEDDSKWEIFGEALRNAGRGSRVLVTTRKKEVAIMMGVSTDQIISLKTLEEKHCWSIFRQLAFTGRRAEDHPQLEPIGKKIAAKSRGLPLVAKTLGSLVRFKETAGQWEEILGSQLWESNDVKVREVFAPFLLSYYDLPPLEKRCFLYCSVFPQDHVINRDDLIKMWMSQGYLGRRADSWKLGRDCFKSLAMRSFFQDFKESAILRDVVECKMHDIVHDFTHFLTGDEYVIMEVEEDEEVSKAVVVENTRHLTLKGRFPNSFETAKNLRTLFFLSSVYVDEILLFSQLTCLRTLSLSYCLREPLLEDIGLLKHLRYLNLSCNIWLKELPKQLFDLCNLETLKLNHCYELKTLPECISKLVSLKHLYIDQCRKLEGLPKGLGKLRGLRTLDTIVLGPKEKGTYLDIGDLKHLQPRGKLEIIIRGTTTSDVSKINLRDVLALQLEFEDCNDTEILTCIHPHPNLNYLVIGGYKGVAISPSWMMPLSNLTILALNRFPNCETLPPLGKLPSLKNLRVAGFSKMRTVGEEFLGINEADDREVMISFPKLEELAFYDHLEWRVWEGCCTKTTKIMPCLRDLTIYDCESLETLPEFLKMTPLQTLFIYGSETLKRHCLKEVGKEWHKISHVPDSRIDDTGVQKACAKFLSLLGCTHDGPEGS